MVLGVLVGADPLLAIGARLDVPVELARLEVTQRLARELPLHDRGHQEQAALGLALLLQMGEGGELQQRLARAGPEGRHHALVRLNQLDQALARIVLAAAHGRRPQLDRLAGFEVLPHLPHHAGDLALGHMAQREALIAGELGLLGRSLIAAAEHVLLLVGAEEPHLRLLEGFALIARGVELVGDGARGIAALHALAQPVDELALARHALLARLRVGGVEVVQVVPDHRPADLQGRARLEPVVMLGEGLAHTGPDHVLQGLVGLLVPVHHVDVAAPVQAGRVVLRRRLVALRLPVGPLGVDRGLPEHVGCLALGLAGFQPLEIGAVLGLLGTFLGHVAVEELTQRALILGRELADLLEGRHALGVLG